MSVRVQQEEPLIEGLGLDDAYARVLLDAFGLGSSSVARVPGPGLPVGIQGEDPAAGGDGEDGLRLPGQAGCSLLRGFRVLAGLVGVDLSLPVHCQEPITMHADAGELGAPAGGEDRGCGLLAVPCVDVQVGSERRLPVVAG